MNAPSEISSMHERHQKLGDGVSPALPQPPKFNSVQEERLHRKQMLAASFRLFSRFGFDEGVAGHITARTRNSQTRFGSTRLACISAKSRYPI